MIRLHTIALAASGFAALSGCGHNAKEAKATIEYIDRKCTIVETEYDADFKKKGSRSYTDDCNSIDEWDKVRNKRSKDIAGNAVVHVSYVAPQDGQSHSGELHYDGHDDAFYQLKAGDEINILVSNADPNRIQKA